MAAAADGGGNEPAVGLAGLAAASRDYLAGGVDNNDDNDGGGG